MLGGDSVPMDGPQVVIVTVLDSESYSQSYIQDIEENRIEYAKKHGKRRLGVPAFSKQTVTNSL